MRDCLDCHTVLVETQDRGPATAGQQCTSCSSWGELGQDVSFYVHTRVCTHCPRKAGGPQPHILATN